VPAEPVPILAEKLAKLRQYAEDVIAKVP